MKKSLLCLVMLLAGWLCACGGANMSVGGNRADYATESVDEAEESNIGHGYAFGDEAMVVDGDRMLAQAAPLEPGAGGGAGPPPPPPAPPTVTDVPAPLTPPAKPTTTTKRLAVPLLIYNAQLNMAVYEATAAIDAVQKMATAEGGYLVKRSDRSITVRVPSAKFRASLAAIGKLGDVLHREESVRDVTEQFYDLRTRLISARAMRNRLQQLLAQAKNVKEALAVERELGRVTTDIERMEGKLKRMRELIAFSTITIEFRPLPVDKVKSKVKLPFPWLNKLGLTNLLNL